MPKMENGDGERRKREQSEKFFFSTFLYLTMKGGRKKMHGNEVESNQEVGKVKEKDE